MGVRVRERRAARDAEVLEERFADEMRRPPARVADADIHVGLAEVHRQELRVAIGEVQQRDLAAREPQVVQALGRLRCRLSGAWRGRPAATAAARPSRNDRRDMLMGTPCPARG